MSRIDDLIADLCPDGVEQKSLGDAGSFIRGNGLQKSDLMDAGVPAIHYGQIHTFYGTWAGATKSFVSEALAIRLRRAMSGDLVIATTSEDDIGVGKATAWLGEGEVAVSGDAYIYHHTLDPRYVSYFFQTDHFQDQKKRHITGTKVRRISGDSLAKIRIPAPPLEIQREIVRVLDTFAELEAELEAELAARKRQYTYYRSTLLACPDNQAQNVALGEVLNLRAGRFVAASEISSVCDEGHSIPCYGGNGVRGFVDRKSHDGAFALIGRQGALCGNVKRVRGEFYATEHAVVVTPSLGVNIDWAFHMLDYMNLNQYATKSAQPGLSVGKLESLTLSIPSLEEQERVANILDSLDALINDLSIGLPAELAARRQQYEHYRDRLLTFEERPA